MRRRGAAESRNHGRLEAEEDPAIESASYFQTSAAIRDPPALMVHRSLWLMASLCFGSRQRQSPVPPAQVVKTPTSIFPHAEHLQECPTAANRNGKLGSRRISAAHQIVAPRADLRRRLVSCSGRSGASKQGCTSQSLPARRRAPSDGIGPLRRWSLSDLRSFGRLSGTP